MVTEIVEVAAGQLLVLVVVFAVAVQPAELDVQVAFHNEALVVVQGVLEEVVRVALDETVLNALELEKVEFQGEALVMVPQGSVEEVVTVAFDNAVVNELELEVVLMSVELRLLLLLTVEVV